MVAHGCALPNYYPGISSAEVLSPALGSTFEQKSHVGLLFQESACKGDGLFLRSRSSSRAGHQCVVLTVGEGGLDLGILWATVADA